MIAKQLGMNFSSGRSLCWAACGEKTTTIEWNLIRAPKMEGQHCMTTTLADQDEEKLGRFARTAGRSGICPYRCPTLCQQFRVSGLAGAI